MVRCIFCINTSSKIQLLNHNIYYINHGYIADISPAGVHRFMWIYYTLALWALGYMHINISAPSLMNNYDKIMS